MWTTFGIMMGSVSDLAFFKVPDRPHIKGLNWHLMLSSVLICIQIFFCPESPRWVMSKGRYADPYKSLERLRRYPVQAARDLYCQCSSFLVTQPLISQREG
jgi:hypothetical protein